MPKENIQKKPVMRWTRELVVRKIRDRAGSWHALGGGRVHKENLSLYMAGRRYFGSWANAVEASGYLCDRVRETGPRDRWSKERILREIRARAAKGLSLQGGRVSFEAARLYQAACRYFRSWRGALEAAGLDHAEILASRPFRSWSRKAVIDELKSRAKKKLSLRARAVILEGTSLHYAARKYLGSWNDALEAAGLDVDEIMAGGRTQRWSKRRVVQAIKARAAKGLSLAFGRVDIEDCSLPSAARRQFGTWAAAVQTSGFDYNRILMMGRRKSSSLKRKA